MSEILDKRLGFEGNHSYFLPTGNFFEGVHFMDTEIYGKGGQAPIDVMEDV